MVGLWKAPHEANEAKGIKEASHQTI